MRRIVASVFTSLDGVMQAPGGPDEDPTGGFGFGGWVAPYFDAELGGAMGEIFARPFDLLLGRKTYDIFASHWPDADAGNPIAGLFNSVTKYVASRGTPNLAWANSKLLGADTLGALKKLKSESGPDLLVQGSADFLQTLWSQGLVDEFCLLSFPVLLGKGKPVFGNSAAPTALKLVKSRTYPTGVIVANYVPDGTVKTGDFQHPQPSAAELERRRNLT